MAKNPHPGYIELEEVQNAITSGALDIGKLWAAVGQGDTPEAAIRIFEAGWDLGDERLGVEDVKDVIVNAVPDDILGQFYRIWVKVGRPKKKKAALAGDAEDDAEYRRGWQAGLGLLDEGRQKAYQWWREVYSNLSEPSWFDMGKGDVISEHWVASHV